MIAFASSLDQAGPLTRDVTDCALLFGAMVGQDPCDSTSLHFPEPVGVPTATDLRGIRLGVPEELSGEGIEEGVLKTFRDTLDRARDLGAEIVDITLPHAPHALAAYYLIAPAEASANLARFDGVRYGLREPADDLLDDVHADARQGLRRRGQAPHHARHLRAVLRLLRRLLRQGPEGPHEDRRGLHRRLAGVRLHGLPDQPRRRVRARGQDRRPVGDVPQRLLHGPDPAGRPARHLDPERARRQAARRASRSPARRSARTASSTPPTRSSRRSASTAPRRAHDRLRARDRAGDPRPALDADEDVLLLRAVLRRGAQHAHLPGLPRPARARCRCSTRGRCTSGS